MMRKTLLKTEVSESTVDTNPTVVPAVEKTDVDFGPLTLPKIYKMLGEKDSNKLKFNAEWIDNVERLLSRGEYKQLAEFFLLIGLSKESIDKFKMF